MLIAIGSDHGGYILKEHIRVCLDEQGIKYKDFGVNSNEAVDYPDYALVVAESVAAGTCSLGIIVCGTGVGVSIAANKVHGIRAALCHDTFSARMAREHNDANILTMGERVVGRGLALEVVKAFIHGKFAGGRHTCRLDKISVIESKYLKKG